MVVQVNSVVSQYNQIYSLEPLDILFVADINQISIRAFQLCSKIKINLTTKLHIF